jgi:hypothetical protein
MRLARSATFWWTGDGGWGGPPRPYLPQQYLKGMSHEMDFKKFEKTYRTRPYYGPLLVFQFSGGSFGF